MPKNLRQLLSECHWPKKNKAYVFLKDQTVAFYLSRAIEAINEAKENELDKNIILAIRLLNLARQKVLKDGTIKTETN